MKLRPLHDRVPIRRVDPEGKTAGVIDPTKVVRATLQGAVSVAGLLITTAAMVAEGRPKNAQQAGSGGDTDF